MVSMERLVMNIPKKVKVGGHVYKIKYPYIFTERFDRNGQIGHDVTTILLSHLDSNGNPKSESAIIETLIHEILHALNYRSGDVIFDKDSDKMEDQVSALSEGILALLVDNGWLMI